MIKNFNEYSKIFEATLSENDKLSIINTIIDGWSSILEDVGNGDLPDYLKDMPKNSQKAYDIVNSGKISTEATGNLFGIANAVVYWKDKGSVGNELTKNFLEILDKRLGEDLEKTSYSNIQDLNNAIEKSLTKRNTDKLSYLPYIALVKNLGSKSESPNPENEVTEKNEPVTISLLKGDENIKFFKDNEFDSTNPNSLIEADTTMVDKMIDELVDALKAGAELKKLIIKTSASRYRNTDASENLSWAGLSFLRASSLSLYFLNRLKEKGLTEDQVSKINSMIQLDPSGENGDGTSGPNPSDVRFGYYDANNKFIEGTDKNQVNTKNIDWSKASATLQTIKGNNLNTGMPLISNEGEEKNIPVIEDKFAYDKFKYINIISEIVLPPSESNKEANKPVSFESNAPELKGMALKINLPSRYVKNTNSGGSKFKGFTFPTIKLNSSPRSSIGKTLRCPKF